MKAPTSALKSYAGTTVAPHRSKEQVEELLMRVGAEGFRWSGFPGKDELEALLVRGERHLGLRLGITYDARDPLQKERKQKLRALYWYMKTKVEAIQFGIVDLEQEFLPYLLTDSMPGSPTVYEKMVEGNVLPMLEAPKP